MASFSKISKERLATCHPTLIRLFEKVVETYDCSILEGYRSSERQNDLFDAGLSKLRYPDGKHNCFPSHAVDVAPYPIDFKELRRFYHFAGFVLATAKSLGIKIRWGGDWDMDLDFTDNKFNDLVHFELVLEVDSLKNNKRI